MFTSDAGCSPAKPSTAKPHHFAHINQETPGSECSKKTGSILNPQFNSCCYSSPCQVVLEALSEFSISELKEMRAVSGGPAFPVHLELGSVMICGSSIYCFRVPQGP